MYAFRSKSNTELRFFKVQEPQFCSEFRRNPVGMCHLAPLPPPALHHAAIATAAAAAAVAAAAADAAIAAAAAAIAAIAAAGAAASATVAVVTAMTSVSTPF